LQTLNKFYCVDIGLAKHILGKNSSADRGHLLENVVFLELLRRNVGVWIGKASSTEVDFVVRTRTGSTEYYQVSETMAHQATRERELGALKSIRDNNRKFVLTMDSGECSYDGIQQLNIVDWLSAEQS
jgi:predicted AAA+ superfamily ATPase